MFRTSYQDAPVWVLNDSPNWTSPFSATVEVPAIERISLRGQEERVPYARSLRWTLRFSLTLQGEAARAIDLGLRECGIEPILIPFWPGGVQWRNRASRVLVGGVYWVQGVGTSALFSTAEPSWPSDCDVVYPVLSGFLRRKKLVRRNANVSEIDIEFNESSSIEWAISPVGGPFESGPMPSNAWTIAPPIIPFKSDAGQINETIDAEEDTDVIGFSRKQLRTDHGAPSASRSSVHLVLPSATDIAIFLKFFSQVSSSGPFWSPCWNSAAVLTGIDLPSNQLAVTDTSGIRVGDWINVTDGREEWTGRVLAIPSPTSITMNRLTALPEAMKRRLPLSTMAVPFRLYRFSDPRISVSWRSSTVMTCDAEWTEVAGEYDAEPPEVMHTTLGALPLRTWLFEFSEIAYAGAVYERFTSFERAVTWNENDYLPGTMYHEAIAQSLDLDRDTVNLTCGLNEVPMLRHMLALKSESPVWVTIFEADLDPDLDVIATRRVFTGEAISIAADGHKVAVRLLSGGTILDRRVSRFLLKPDCNHDLFSVGCTLPSSDWKFTASVSSPGTAGFPFEFYLSGLTRVTGPLPNYFAHWFAGGWIEFGTGTQWTRRAILDSSTVNAGGLLVTLSRDPDPFPAAGTPVVLYPGCDGRRQTCQAWSPTNTQGKFNNYPNFGGHPYMPVGNPTLVKISTPAHSGGKK